MIGENSFLEFKNIKGFVFLEQIKVDYIILQSADVIIEIISHRL